MRSAPTSSGVKPASLISLAATLLARASSAQYTTVGRLPRRRRRANTANNTSLGTELSAETTLALGIFFASASAPDEVWPITRRVSDLFIGSEHVTTTLPDRSPAFRNTSLTRDQCTARRTASASRAASSGGAGHALPRG